MGRISKTVALVLDPDFGDQVLSLAKEMPVWIVASPLNDLTIGMLRSKFEEGHLTTLLTLPGEQSSDTLSRALFAIDEHHGAESQADPYDAVEVYGAKDTPSPEFCSELDFKSVIATDYGFRAQK